MEKYKIVLTGPTGSKAPDYILNLRMHIKAYFSQPYGKEEFGHVLHCISSFIDDFTFKVRNSRYRGETDRVLHLQRAIRRHLPVCRPRLGNELTKQGTSIKRNIHGKYQ
ncbi:hypothetical protein HMPREF1069_04879 [Bacteroides ovatus CL02T12C04]|uniref:hypothetical protein n=1 Tax=Bacteroides TaxID=816 RepID=UPI000269241A|nr:MULTISPECIES: hypothetical protein [Bacteroides]EIY58389.1 hypothetical protein HMPREF1069_04879 [Bacteroides ovatus CL02T12C04]OFK94285.1 hypothetical protein HMPREF2794_19940 [Bacteroides sp. HMSC067B03]